MPTTLKDIAAAAGVSIGTVDRALKNRGRINPEVAERIKELAREMDYHQNKIAAGLVTRTKNYKIAVILHITGNNFFDEILKGIRKAEKEIRDYGMSIKIYPCEDFNAAMQLSNIETAIEEGANAIVIVPINAPIIGKKIRQLHKENFPVVFLNTYLNRVPALSSIHCDYFRSGKIGGKLIDLFSRGSGHVMAFFPSTVMLGNNVRKEGFEKYFESCSSGLILEKIVELTNNGEINYETMVAELKAHSDVDSVLFCGDADIALRALEAIDRPINAVFYNYDNVSRQALSHAQINAAIAQEAKEQGYQAVNVIFQYFLSGKVPPKEILMDSQIMLRECIE